MSLSNPFVSLALLCTLTAFPPATAAGPAPAPALRACDDAYLGVYVTPAEDGGATVTRLIPGSPAEEAGLQRGDRIVSLGDAEVGEPAELTEAVQDHQAGDEVELVVYRGDEELTLGVRLGNRSEAESRGDFQPTPLAQAAPEDGTFTWQSSTPAPGFDMPPVRFQRQAAPAPSSAGSEQLEQRLDELRQRMDERFEDLSSRLQELREEHADAGLDERLGRFQAELEADRESQQRRVEELRSALRREKAHGQERSPEPSPGISYMRAPAAAGAPGASAGEIQALRDEVRSLRDEIRELKELITR